MAEARANRFRDGSALEAMGGWLRRLPLGVTGRAVLKRVYHAALMLGTGGRGLRSQLPGGEVMRVSPEYRYISWNPIEYAAFRGAMKAGGVALDVGANVGAYTVLLAQWARPSGMVYAFEPAPDAFNGLVAHVALNGVGGTVRPIQSAVGDVPATAEFVVGATAGQGRLATASERAHTISVPVTTIDEFCARERIVPDFIKIDVEGSEIAVLRGARDTLRRVAASAAVFVELHPAVWPRIGTSRDELETELAAQNLTLDPIAPIHDWVEVEGMCLRVVPASAAASGPRMKP